MKIRERNVPLLAFSSIAVKSTPVSTDPRTETFISPDAPSAARVSVLRFKKAVVKVGFGESGKGLIA